MAVCNMKSSKSTKKEILTKIKEDAWRISPSMGIPTYKADLDPFCPSGQIKKFNDEKKLNAKIIAEQNKRSTQWNQSIVESNFKDVPLKVNVNLRTKAMNSVGSTQIKQEHYAEVEILQKIIVRENLLNELHKLVKSPHDIVTNMSEIVELVKALRFQTVDIIEDISAWQDVQTYPKPFLFREINYLIKIKGDLDFLDYHDEVIEKFCFEFKNNPLAYRGGGNLLVISGTTSGTEFNSSSSQQYGKGLINSYYDPVDSSYIDDMEVYRLHNAERVIHKEILRLAADKSKRMKEESVSQSSQYDSNSNLGYPRSNGVILPPVNPYDCGNNSQSSQQKHLYGSQQNNVGSSHKDAPTRRSMDALPAHIQTEQQQLNYKSSSAGNLLRSNESNDSGGFGDTKPKKIKKVKKTSAGSGGQLFNPRKVKLERIATLNEEAGELKAMMSHIEDQMATLVLQHDNMAARRKAYEAKHKEALQQGREASATHIAAEISVLKAQMQELSTRVKDLQRENYFVCSERKRKTGVVQTLREELEEAKRRETLKRKIEAKIKKEGLLAALQSFSSPSAKNPVSPGAFTEIAQKLPGNLSTAEHRDIHTPKKKKKDKSVGEKARESMEQKESFAFERSAMEGSETEQKQTAETTGTIESFQTTNGFDPHYGLLRSYTSLDLNEEEEDGEGEGEGENADEGVEGNEEEEDDNGDNDVDEGEENDYNHPTSHDIDQSNFNYNFNENENVNNYNDNADEEQIEFGQPIYDDVNDDNFNNVQQHTEYGYYNGYVNPKNNFQRQTSDQLMTVILQDGVDHSAYNSYAGSFAGDFQFDEQDCHEVVIGADGTNVEGEEDEDVEYGETLDLSEESGSSYKYLSSKNLSAKLSELQLASEYDDGIDAATDQLNKEVNQAEVDDAVVADGGSGDDDENVVFTKVSLPTQFHLDNVDTADTEVNTDMVIEQQMEQQQTVEQQRESNGTDNDINTTADMTEDELEDVRQRKLRQLSSQNNSQYHESEESNGYNDEVSPEVQLQVEISEYNHDNNDNDISLLTTQSHEDNNTYQQYTETTEHLLHQQQHLDDSFDTTNNENNYNNNDINNTDDANSHGENLDYSCENSLDGSEQHSEFDISRSQKSFKLPPKSPKMLSPQDTFDIGNIRSPIAELHYQKSDLYISDDETDDDNHTHTNTHGHSVHTDFSRSGTADLSLCISPLSTINEAHPMKMEGSFTYDRIDALTSNSHDVDTSLMYSKSHSYDHQYSETDDNSSVFSPFSTNNSLQFSHLMAATVNTAEHFNSQPLRLHQHQLEQMVDNNTPTTYAINADSIYNHDYSDNTNQQVHNETQYKTIVNCDGSLTYEYVESNKQNEQSDYTDSNQDEKYSQQPVGTAYAMAKSRKNANNNVGGGGQQNVHFSE